MEEERLGSGARSQRHDEVQICRGKKVNDSYRVGEPATRLEGGRREGPSEGGRAMQRGRWVTPVVGPKSAMVVGGSRVQPV